MAIIVSDYQQKGRRAKMPVSEKQAKPTKLIIIRGLPGSGKSYIAKNLADKLDALHTQLIDPDAIDYDSNDYKSLSAELLLEGVDTKLHPYRYLRALAYRAISAEKAVIWNQAFTHQDLLDRTIKNLQNYATEHHISILIFVIEVSIDIDVAKKRVLNRTVAGGHGVSEVEFVRFITDYKTFAGYGYPIIQVDGSNNVSDSVDKILFETK